MQPLKDALHKAVAKDSPNGVWKPLKEPRAQNGWLVPYNHFIIIHMPHTQLLKTKAAHVDRWTRETSVVHQMLG